MMNTEQLNKNFIEALNYGKMEKVATDAEGWMQMSVAEASVQDKICPATKALQQELQRSADHNEPIMLIDINNPNDHHAALMNFNAEGNSRIYRGRRLEARFVKIESDKMRMNKIELMASPKNVRKY